MLKVSETACRNRPTSCLSGMQTAVSTEGMRAFMAAPDFEATDANCHPSRDGEVLMAGANPAGRPFSISDGFRQDTGRRANGFMNLYRYKRTTRIFPMRSDNVALSLLMLHNAKPAGRSAKMRPCQPQRDAGTMESELLHAVPTVCRGTPSGNLRQMLKRAKELRNWLIAGGTRFGALTLARLRMTPA